MLSRQEKKHGVDRLEHIIEMCICIENHQVEPFTINIDDILRVVKDYFPKWENPDELKLDAEVLHHLASVIKMQSDWIKQRSTLLYTDPFLLEEKIRQTSKEVMADVFIRTWCPIVDLEQLSLQSLAQGLLYWKALDPIGERWKGIDSTNVTSDSVSRSELVKQRILSIKEFSEELECFFVELKAKVNEKGVNGKIAYWDFIGSDSYEETVQRAFFTSFLITYGYATLEIDRLEESIFIVPFAKQRRKELTSQSTSVPIALFFEDWKKWEQGVPL